MFYISTKQAVGKYDVVQGLGRTADARGPDGAHRAVLPLASQKRRGDMKLCEEAPMATRGEITPKLGFALVVVPRDGVDSFPSGDGGGSLPGGVRRINAMAVLVQACRPPRRQIRDAGRRAISRATWLKARRSSAPDICRAIRQVTGGLAFARPSFAGKSLIFYRLMRFGGVAGCGFIVPEPDDGGELGPLRHLERTSCCLFDSGLRHLQDAAGVRGFRHEPRETANDGAGAIKRIRPS